MHEAFSSASGLEADNPASNHKLHMKNRLTMDGTANNLLLQGNGSQFSQSTEHKSPELNILVAAFDWNRGQRQSRTPDTGTTSSQNLQLKPQGNSKVCLCLFK